MSVVRLHHIPSKPQAKPETKAQHGTVSRYVLGCRCRDCRDAANTYARERKARQRAKAGIRKPPGHYAKRTINKPTTWRCVVCHRTCIPMVHCDHEQPWQVAQAADDAFLASIADKPHNRRS